jgi:hypothetical protein
MVDFGLPSFWELLIPNFNTFTVIGIVLIVVSLLIIFLGTAPVISQILSFFKLNPLPVVLILWAVAFVLIWGVSIFQDVWATLNGKVIIIMGSVILLFAVYRLNQIKPKKNGGML